MTKDLLLRYPAGQETLFPRFGTIWWISGYMEFATWKDLEVQSDLTISDLHPTICVRISVSLSLSIAFPYDVLVARDSLRRVQYDWSWWAKRGKRWCDGTLFAMLSPRICGEIVAEPKWWQACILCLPCTLLAHDTFANAVHRRNFMRWKPLCCWFVTVIHFLCVVCEFLSHLLALDSSSSYSSASGAWHLTFAHELAEILVSLSDPSFSFCWLNRACPPRVLVIFDWQETRSLVLLG